MHCWSALPLLRFRHSMPLTTVVVHWRGPLGIADVAKSGTGNGIYLLTGKQRYQWYTQIQYCGITEGPFAQRISSKHHKLSHIRKDTIGVWLGQIDYPQAFDRSHLEIAEHCFVSFWQPDLNVSKSVYYPRNPICLISQWFTPDGEPRRRRPSIIRNLPDVMWWDKERWRTGRLRVGAIGT